MSEPIDSVSLKRLRRPGMSMVPTAISRLGEDDSRESQNLRAVKWLLAQDGGPIVIVTPRRAGLPHI